MLPGEGKQESGYALGNDHELVKIRAPYEHLVLEEDAREELNDAVYAKPGEDVLERVVEQRQLFAGQRLVDHELEGRFRGLVVGHVKF